jgi:hypothetical protein
VMVCCPGCSPSPRRSQPFEFEPYAQRAPGQASLAD